MSAAPRTALAAPNRYTAAVAEQAGDQPRRGTGNAVGDVEKSDEGSHRTTSVGWQHPLERLYSERREDQRTPESSDEGSSKRDDLVWGAPDERLADRLDGEGPKRYAIAPDLVRQMPEHDTHEDKPTPNAVITSPAWPQPRAAKYSEAKAVRPDRPTPCNIRPTPRARSAPPHGKTAGAGRHGLAYGVAPKAMAAARSGAMTQATMVAGRP